MSEGQECQAGLGTELAAVAGKKPTGIKVHMLDLLPTQLSVGMQQVHAKMAKLKKKIAEGKLKQYLQKKLIPWVQGPQGKQYLIDHHHLTRALINLDLRHCYLEPAAHRDFSHITDEEHFWEAMRDNVEDSGQKRPLAWLFKPNGKALTAAEFIDRVPKTVEGLQDDPYRSLAALIRKKQPVGYIKDPNNPVPFLEVGFC